MRQIDTVLRSRGRAKGMLDERHEVSRDRQRLLAVVDRVDFGVQVRVLIKFAVQAFRQQRFVKSLPHARERS